MAAIRGGLERSGMRKDVRVRPAQQVELGTGGQEAEAALRDGVAVLPPEPGVQSRLHGMEVENVGCPVVELRLREGLGAPVGGLLLLREFDVQELPHEVLEPKPIRVGAGEPRGDLGAVDRSRHDPEIVEEHGQVEAREMKDLQHALVGEDRSEEHTSELQSRQYLVCRLLLEKK